MSDREVELRQALAGIKTRKNVAVIHLVGGPVIVGMVEGFTYHLVKIEEGTYPLPHATPPEEYRFKSYGKPPAVVSLRHVTMIGEAPNDG